MAHALIDNRTPFAVEPLFLVDEEGCPVVTPLVQATYEILDTNRLTLAVDQPKPNVSGELWNGDPSTSCYRVEPAFAFIKCATDVALVGHAYSPRGRGGESADVTFRVGPVQKRLRVTGDRVWVRSMGAIHMTSPLPFDRIPLSYERAFGGWDKSASDPRSHSFEPKNPVGVGFRAPGAAFQEGLAVPNIEDPSDPVTRYGEPVTVAGVGFLSSHFQPRLALAGTFDEAWRRDRMPLLPRDFDRRFFNASPPGLVAPGFLRGDEPVVVEGASRRGTIALDLPGARAITCRIARSRGGDATIELVLDTIIVDTDVHRVLMLYRGYARLLGGPHDVTAIAITTPTSSRRRAA